MLFDLDHPDQIRWCTEWCVPASGYSSCRFPWFSPFCRDKPARHENDDSLTSSVFVSRDQCCVFFLQCYQEIRRKLGLPRRTCARISLSSSDSSSSTLLQLLLPFLLLLLIPIFLETLFTFDLTLPLIRPFANSARQDTQTPWWAALAQQAQRWSSSTNRPLWPECLKEKVDIRICHRYTMYKYKKLRFTKYIPWIYINCSIIAIVYTIDIPRISYMFSSYKGYITRICFQRVHMAGISKVYAIRNRDMPVTVLIWE